MQYRSVGRSGLRISAVSIGGWVNFGAKSDYEASKAVLRASIEAGINFIDLADVYARGEAERVAGVALEDYERSELVISSKVFGKMSDGPNDRGLSRKHIMESVDRSLRNLRTDYLDIYFCHRPDPETPLEETARAMDDLVHQGKVLYWGTSVFPAATLQRAHDLADHRGLYAPRVEQPEYNLLERSIEADVMPAAERLGMGLVVWSPLAGGILTGKYNDGVPAGSRGAETKWLEGKLTDDNLDRVRAFCGLAAEMSVEPGQLALAWILTRPAISCVITGATDAAQVAANVKAAEIELPDEVARKIDALFPAGD
ncbi:MAG: aldo/keto reductase [bacterium]|nr:aldo/keto reductase [bacterium]